MKESGAHAIKLEGGREVSESIERIVKSGIPVMGHLGLTPQSIYKFGTYNVRAKEEVEANILLEDVRILQDKGCFAVVVEKIPATLAKQVSSSVEIPIIGIGAGNDVDGQVLVMHDMLGINNEFAPRFLRKYATLYETIKSSVEQYIVDVKTKDFPNESEQY
jgi:3-methyl-2-oxobutanoate hydroxymethyltransferase